MSHAHVREQCEHGVVVMQCKCMDKKTVKIVPCPKSCPEHPDNRRCPDDGKCHHECASTECFRVRNASPLSITGWEDWPLGIVRRFGSPRQIEQAELLHSETLSGEFARWYYGDDGDDDAAKIVEKLIKLLQERPEEERAEVAGFVSTDRDLCTYHGWLCHNPLDCDLVILYRRKPGSPKPLSPRSGKH